MQLRTILWPTLAAGSALIVLLGLGTWQLQRLAWKQDLTARIEARAHAKPIGLEKAVAQWRDTGEVEYLKIRLDGAFHNAREAHVFTVQNSQTGWRVISPFASGDHIVLVDRGFVPDQLKAPGSRAAGRATSVAAITGLARVPTKQSYFVPDNDPARNSWFWRDVAAISESLLEPADRSRVLPFIVEADNTPVAGGWPRGGVTRLTLSNKHLEYALTWFGLAATLVFVYGFFIYGRLRAPKTPDSSGSG